MAFLKRQSNWIFANVVDGGLRVGPKGSEVMESGVSGTIAGIRIRHDVFEGKQIPKLELLIKDSRNADSRNPEENAGPDIVITGTLAANNNITTWARMLIGRLVNPVNKFLPKEILELQFYSNSDARATCVAIRRPGSDLSLPQIAIDKSDPKHYNDIIAHIEELKNVYGTFGRAEETLFAEAPASSVPAGTDDGLPF